MLGKARRQISFDGDSSILRTEYNRIGILEASATRR